MWFFRYVGPNPIKLLKCWAKRKGCFDTWSEIFPFYGSIIFQDIAYCGGRGNLHFIPKRSGKNPLRRPCLTRIYFLQRTDANKHKEETAEFDFTGKFILTQHYGFAYTWSYAEWEWAWKKHCGKTKKAFFSLSFVSDIPCNPVQSLCEGLWQRTNYYFKGSLLFKPQHSTWKSSKMSHLHFW